MKREWISLINSIYNFWVDQQSDIFKYFLKWLTFKIMQSKWEDSISHSLKGTTINKVETSSYKKKMSLNRSLIKRQARPL